MKSAGLRERLDRLELALAQRIGPRAIGAWELEESGSGRFRIGASLSRYMPFKWVCAILGILWFFVIKAVIAEAPSGFSHLHDLPGLLFAVLFLTAFSVYIVVLRFGKIEFEITTDKVNLFRGVSFISTKLSFLILDVAKIGMESSRSEKWICIALKDGKKVYVGKWLDQTQRVWLERVLREKLSRISGIEIP